MESLDRMRDAMVRYFAAEKHESLLFMAIGAAAIIASVVLFMTASSYRGMSYPLVVIALIQIAVGGSVYFRTDTQVAALSAQMSREPAAYKAAELARMEKISKNFEIYKVIEIVLLAAGIVMAYALRRSDTFYAVAIGLIMQASVMLVLDLFAERRADTYVVAVSALSG
jgi:hypothetical protein